MEINIGEQLKKIRITQQLTQEDIGAHLYLTRQTISKWENGKSIPDLENLILLSQLYDVSLDELVGLKTLSYSSESIKKTNKKKEKVLLLTKNTKLLLATVATFFIISIGISISKDYSTRNSIAYADSFLIYGVESITYEKNSPSKGQTRGKIESIVLKGDRTLQNPTLEEMKDLKLNQAVYYLNNQNDGVRVDVRSFH